MSDFVNAPVVSRRHYRSQVQEIDLLSGVSWKLRTILFWATTLMKIFVFLSLVVVPSLLPIVKYVHDGRHLCIAISLSAMVSDQRYG